MPSDKKIVTERHSFATEWEISESECKNLQSSFLPDDL
jgi:hypothetical protein